MKKIFTKRLVMCMVAAFLATVLAVFALQTYSNGSLMAESSRTKIADVKAKLQANDANIAKLTEFLGQVNLAKTRAFADLLAADPTLGSDRARMQQVRDRMMVNEVCVVNAAGIITGTSEDYAGFDMNSGEQSRAFMAIVQNPTLEIVQAPQKNATKGILMQYIGVVRKDAPGLVQVAVRPQMLEQALAGTEIATVLRDIDFGTTGYVYAIDKASGKILAHPDANLIGNTAAAAGFADELAGQGDAVVDGVAGHYYAEAVNDKIIGTFLPDTEFYAARRTQTLVMAVSLLVIFGMLLAVINHLVDTKIVRGLNHLTEATRQVAAGNYELAVREYDNPEFSQISNSINKMVENIRSHMTRNDTLLTEQTNTVQQSQDRISNIRESCQELSDVSEATQQAADSIMSGTGKQEQALADLNGVMGTLKEQLNASVVVSGEVAASTEAATAKIEQAQGEMAQLQDSMRKIGEMSDKIETIIGDIEAIAEQTNLLSLNASIEAARAGESGRGFAVVASQIGELATRSATAAGETRHLIGDSQQAVGHGREVTEQTARTFGDVVAQISQSRQSVNRVAQMVQSNVSGLQQAADQLGQISSVVEENVRISQTTKKVSDDMAKITDTLLRVIGK